MCALALRVVTTWGKMCIFLGSGTFAKWFPQSKAYAAQSTMHGIMKRMGAPPRQKRNFRFARALHKNSAFGFVMFHMQNKAHM